MPMQFDPATGRFEDTDAGTVKKKQETIPSVATGQLKFNPATGRFDSGTTTTTPVKAAAVKKKGPVRNLVGFATKQLAKSGGALAEVYQGVGRGIATGIRGGTPGRAAGELLKGLGGAGQVLAGRKETSFSEKLRRAQETIERSDSAFGKAFIPKTKVGQILTESGADIVLDPLNLVGGGLTQAGRVAKIAGQLREAGTAIRKGSQIAKGLKKFGDVPLAATKAQQAAKGQRAFLTVAGKPVIKGEKIYKATEGLGKYAGASRLGQAARKTFTTKTTNAAFDIFRRQERNLVEYGLAKDAEYGKGILKQLRKFSDEEKLLVSRVIEQPELRNQAPEAVVNMADSMSEMFKGLATKEKKAGVIKSTIEDYFPHIRKKEGILSSIKGAREFSPDLGAAEHRGIKKITDEAGNVAYGKTKDFGLEPLNATKGLADNLLAGEVTALDELAAAAKRFGYDVEFKPKSRVRGSASGYFDFSRKKIVVAAARPFEEVMSTLKHEILHSAHFQYGGRIEMLETFTGRGKAVKLRKLLEAAKTAAKKDAEFIADSHKIDLEDVSPRFRGYFKKPAELLAFAMSTASKDANRARVMFPKTMEAIDDLMKSDELFKILNIKPGQDLRSAADLWKETKTGRIFQVSDAPAYNINKAFGKNFFELNPAIAATTRRMRSTVAISGKRFLKGVKQFGASIATGDAPEGWVASTAKDLKGLVFEPEVAQAIDKYMVGMKPEEIKIALRVFDKVQNLWKAQVLLSPAYHVRNMAGNYWNNFLAGVIDPNVYVEAKKLTSGSSDKKVFTTPWGQKLTGVELLEEAKKLGVLNQGVFAKDIEAAIDITRGNFNPLDQNFIAFKANRYIGEAVENNARMAHFIDRVNKGDSFADASMSVKKYLFDYGDLSDFERGILKRVLPFYTWTRKNIPLQLAEMIKQPKKYAVIDKFIRAIEGNVEEPDEQYLSDYIRENVPIRVNKTEDGVTHYFLLGQWLPATQALDFLDQPFENIKAMVTPFVKIPIETVSNKSLFFKDTLGKASEIERYEEEVGSFLGVAMRKKVINVMRNIRVLNEIDKLNPGEIWGTQESESIWSKLIGEESFTLPKIGTISTAQQRGTSYTPDTTGTARGLNLFFGKLQGFDPEQSKTFYDWDTTGYASDLARSIKTARNRGQGAYADELQARLDAFEEERKPNPTVPGKKKTKLQYPTVPGKKKTKLQFNPATGRFE